MGNQCENCFENSPQEKPQLMCSNYLILTKGYVDSQPPAGDKLFSDYINQREWTREKKTLKKNANTNKYFYGDWHNNLPQGKGVLYQPNKILIDSFFVGGLPNGQSKVIFIDKNSEYVGELLDGRINGNGIMTDFAQKYTFSGIWANSMPKAGILVLGRDSNVDRIQFIDFQSKIGKIFYKDGRLYQGDIDNRRLIPHGRGRVQFTKFDVKDYYDGDWKDGMYHGNGAFHWKNGEYYIGGYQLGQKQGFGNFKFHSGSQYEGNWSGGKQHGVGTLFDRNGFIAKQGVWKQGTFVGPDRFHNVASQVNKAKTYFDSGEFQQIKQDFISQNFDQIISFHALRPDLSTEKTKFKQLTMQNVKHHSQKY